MRNWDIPDQWAASKDAALDALREDDQPELIVRPMRRQPLRKSGGFLQIDNVFAELDDIEDRTR